jgi:FMN phosphatase YigB (HAD superfamily)
MRKVILDLNGVVLNDVTIPVITNAVQKFGTPKALLMLVCYKLNIARNLVYNPAVEIMREQTKCAHFMPGAEDALGALTKIPNTRVDVCSATDFGDSHGYMEYRLRDKSDGMRRVLNFEFVPHGASKKDFYQNASTGFNETWVVDDSLAHIKSAYELGLNPVLISDNKLKIARAGARYNARCFANLGEFANFLVNKK